MSIHELIKFAIKYAASMSAKMVDHTLTEYEQLSFEATCNMITQFSKT